MCAWHETVWPPRGTASVRLGARNIGPARLLHPETGRNEPRTKHAIFPDLVARAPGGLAIGIVLQGTYRIIRPLAEGGCGEVYLAAHTRLPGRFAVKLLHRSLTRDSDALARFRQEAEITSSLRHPHIVQVFDFNVTDTGVPFLVMELLEGKLLSERIRRSARSTRPPPSTSSTRSRPLFTRPTRAGSCTAI